MKLLAAAVASLALFAASVQAQETNAMPKLSSTLARQDVEAVAPVLDKYTQDHLLDEVWKRPGLSLRDRSLVTVAALIANGQVAQIPYHLNRAMDNGLTQTEASEAVAQLAFYVGWRNVFSALPIMKEVFEKRPH